MASQFRTAFMAPSGFATAAAPVTKGAPATTDRKLVAKARASGRPIQETKVDVRKKVAAA